MGAHSKSAKKITPAAKQRGGKGTPASPAGVDRQESVIVYVHGFGRHPAPAALKLEWDLALFGKDLRERSRMACWADLLHPVAAAGAKSMRRRSVGSDAALDLDALREARRGCSGRAHQLVQCGVSRQRSSFVVPRREWHQHGGATRVGPACSVPICAARGSCAARRGQARAA